MKKHLALTIIAILIILDALLFAYATGLNTLIFPINSTATVPSAQANASIILGQQTLTNGSISAFDFGTLTLDSANSNWISNQTLAITDTGNTNLTVITITLTSSNYTDGSQIELDANGVLLANSPIDNINTPIQFSYIDTAFNLSPSDVFNGFLTVETPATTTPSNYSLDFSISIS